MDQLDFRGVLPDVSFDEKWSFFLELLEKPKSIAQIPSILYMGASIPLFTKGSGELSDEKRNVLFTGLLKKIDFFLTASECDGVIGTTAQQLIIKKIINQFLELAWHGLANPMVAVMIFEKITQFLSIARDSLRGKPYPRFIGNFLNILIANDFFKNGGMKYDPSLIVIPCIVWGKSELLHRLTSVPQGYIKESLLKFIDGVNQVTANRRISSSLIRAIDSMRECPDLEQESFYPIEKASVALALHEALYQRRYIHRLIIKNQPLPTEKMIQEMAERELGDINVLNWEKEDGIEYNDPATGKPKGLVIVRIEYGENIF